MADALEFEALVDNHSKEIFAYLWRLLHNPEEAEDCLQETFLRAFRAFGRLEESSNQRAWLYKIATNVARTRAKRLVREQLRTADLDARIPAGGPPVAERVEMREKLAAVLRAVDELPPTQKAALMMRKYQGLSYAEIAEALDSTSGSARASVYQALKKLHAQFPEFAYDRQTRTG